jgi:2-methylcitrate dehydratase PrpD
MTGATQALAAGLGDAARAGLPDDVRRETLRSLLNVVGASVGAAGTAEVELLVRHAQACGATGSSPVPGRRETLEASQAALVTGFAAHLDDFDDTHLATVVHPGAAVLAAALPLVARDDVAPLRLLDALALGIEAQLRVALAMTPSHYDQGWHVTGTVGPLGAAVTAALLRGVDDEQLGHAIAIASSMSLGHRQGFGTMVKPFHPGKAAANGLLAAALAARGSTGAPAALEGARGYFRGMAPSVALDRVTEGLGSRWDLLDNTYKPYPCGIVSHPAIEAAEWLSEQLAGATPAAVRVRCHPLVVELTGNPDPHTGLAARFSTVHGVAVALADGVAGLAQYEDDRVRADDVSALRALVTLVPDDEVARDEAIVEVETVDGRSHVEHVEHARGSLARPLTDAELDDKVAVLVERTLAGRGVDVVRAVRSLPERSSSAFLIAALTPETT